MKLPIYNCLIDEDPTDETGVYAISFVEEPANETDFVALSKHSRQEFLSMDHQKQILTGVVLRPEQLIYRNSDVLGEHYIKFSAAQIEKIAHKMMREGIALHNTSHEHAIALDGNYLVELWIVEDPGNDKSKALGFADLPKGTLMCSYKIKDREYWDSQVLSGNVKGFSLEGIFFQQKTNEQLTSNLNKMYNTNKNKSTTAAVSLGIENVRKNDATQSGTAYLVFSLSDGSEAFTDSDGFTTLDGIQMPAGEHLLADGNLLEIDRQGQFMATKAPQEQNNKQAAHSAPQALSYKVKRMFNSARRKNRPMNNAEKNDASAEGFSARMNEVEKSLAQIASHLENLSKATPSAYPAAQPQTREYGEHVLSHSGRMAASLAAQIQRKA
jgi:hypothetical protein